MKMHRVPKLRHNKHVEAVSILPRVATDKHPEPYHIGFTFDGGATSVLTMTRDEAVTLFEALGVCLRFEGAKASEIETDHWADCHKDMRRAITPVCSHDWEDGYSMNGPTKTCRKCGLFMRD